MPDAHGPSVEVRHPAYGLAVLYEVEVESRPASAEARPSADGVSGEEDLPLRPVEGEVTG